MNKYVVVVVSITGGIEQVVGDFWTSFQADQWLAQQVFPCGTSGKVMMMEAPVLQGESH